MPLMKLEDMVVAKKSPIHGKGAFARRKIRKNTQIGTYEGPIRKKRNGMHVLWVEEEDGTVFGIDGKNVLRYLNHSSTPNAEFDGADLYAIRTIQKGDEITFDYGEDWADTE